MARLRGPGGCPWDREQSFDSIRKYTLEETYEVFDAIERRDFPHLAEELGDLLLQVLFYAEMAANEGISRLRCIGPLERKLVRRHPHVFGDEASRAAGNKADVDAAVEGSSAAVLRNWEEIKSAEKRRPEKRRVGGALLKSTAASRLDSVQRALPALAEAAKLGAKAQKAGFDWPELAGSAAEAGGGDGGAGGRGRFDDPARKPFVEAELGDLLFTAVNLGRHLGVDAEMALGGATGGFGSASRRWSGRRSGRWRSWGRKSWRRWAWGEAEAGGGGIVSGMREENPSGAKAHAYFGAFSARLKPCPKSKASSLGSGR
jgi:MazG family protein